MAEGGASGLSQDRLDGLANAMSAVDQATVTLDYENFAIRLRPDRTNALQFCPRELANARVKATLSKRNELIQAFIEQVQVLLELRAPSEVVLNRQRVSTAPSNQGFPNTAQVLGAGNSAGDILVLTDTQTGQQYAKKTIMISEFHGDHIKTWVHMADKGKAPELYSFSLEANKVVFKMEVLEGKTLEGISNDLLGRQDASHLIRPFSLIMLNDLLKTYDEGLLSGGFTHGDLHGGNVMVSKDIQMKIIDFGSARHLLHVDVPQKAPRIKHDIIGIIRMFTLLYSGYGFEDNQQTIQFLESDTFSRLNRLMLPISEDHRVEMYTIIMELFGCVRDPNQEGFGQIERVRKIIEAKLHAENINIEDLKREVAVIMFPQFRNDGPVEEADGDYEGGMECETFGDDEDDHCGIWDHPKMEVYKKNVTDEAMKKLGIFC